jgi:hypothetical protein
VIVGEPKFSSGDVDNSDRAKKMASSATPDAKA